MPTVALIGPELYPIPPIRGGAAELFIEKVAGHLRGWRPVVIGVSVYAAFFSTGVEKWKAEQETAKAAGAAGAAATPELTA